MWGTKTVFHGSLGEPLAEVLAATDWHVASEIVKNVAQDRAKTIPILLGNSEIGYLVGLIARVETFLQCSRSGQNLSLNRRSVKQKNGKPTSHFLA